MRVVVVALLVLLALIQYRLWVGDESLAEVARLREAVERQREENEALRQRNQRLAAEVRDLKQGLAAVEERARRELGMTARDETFFQFTEDAPAARP